MELEIAPKIDFQELLKRLGTPFTPELRNLIDKCNAEYEHWSKIKYIAKANGMSPRDLWVAVLADRLIHRQDVWPTYNIHFSLSNRMQKLCHEFDMNFGGSWGNDAIIQNSHRERYLVSSLMEEAISSSQMEGAATTRKVAKEMLRKKLTPKDRSQQMIHNNYQTIQFIVENKQKDLTPELLMQVHRLMTEQTLDDANDAGRFRQDDKVVVMNELTGEIVHTPPTHTELPKFVADLCVFFNSTDDRIFIHPIIRAIIVHFMLAYAHPFVDGNGRTARALFYWYMLKRGYWLTEYLSISRVIYKSKAAYEKSYLFSESENNDIGYFISYNLRVLEIAFKELQSYITRKNKEREAAQQYLRIGGLNARQAEVIKMFADNPKLMITVKELQARFNISPTTAKSDIVGLIERGLIIEIQLNRVKRGYVRSEKFEDLIKQ